MGDTQGVYSQDLAGCLAAQVGAEGLNDAQFADAQAAAARSVDYLRDLYKEQSLPLLHLGGDNADLDACAPFVAALRRDCSDILVLGTGGSSLGAQALAQLRGFRTTFDRALSDAPNLYFLDNLDADSLDRALEALDLSTTGVMLVSKSGGTAETMMQALAVVQAFRAAGLVDKLAGQAVAITMPGDRVLRRFADNLNIPVLDHNPGVGGRFSVLTNVGLMPAMILGLDAATVRASAFDVLQAGLDGDKAAFAPAIGAAVSLALAKEKGKTQSVMLPYTDRLERLAFWYRQLWAESLGKQGCGTTPVNSLGPVDQHSQLQLYLDGPNDKLVSVMMTASRGQGARLGDPGDPDLAYLAGKTVGDLVDAEQRATAETLIKHQRPTRIFRIDQPNEQTLGALLMHFMLETILAAHILGIDAFDQPAVEEGKVLARQYLAEM